MSGLSYALAAFGAMVAFILVDGLWTTRLYRHGGFHRWLARVAPWGDAPGAMVTTFCSCMTQGPVATWAQAGAEARAARWLGWASVLRPTAVLGAFWLSPAIGVLFLVAALLYGLGAGRWLGAISPGATFLVRRPKGLGDWFGDSARETGMMVRAYGVVMLGCAALGGVAWMAPPLPAWTGVLGVLGVFVPVDLLAALPVLVALGAHGAPHALVVGLGAGALTCARRPDRLFRGYLRVDAYGRHRALARAFPLFLTLGALAL